ncbi:MAG: rod shape-determining protein MreC [Candidatus Omnitrophica bacterium]|nr:rod shape-determining protein MreC [Candidatus Omnitrophota bacterium]MCF7893146.1 rod shape-determining protein MreC [Candidatus Omnitrophota bacterium]
MVIALLAFTAFRRTFQTLILSLSKSFFTLSKTSYQEKIESLNKKNLSYRLELKKNKKISEENKILREALNFKNKNNLSLVGAEIIAFSPSSWNQYIFLNSGSGQGIKKNMLVVDKDGNLIGKVKKTYQNRCKVILVKNPDFQMPVSVNNQLLGLLQGTLSGVEILYIEKSNEINIAEPVYAAFSPFASAVKIGQISKIERSKNNLFYEIQVDIFAKDKLPQVVFILK